MILNRKRLRQWIDLLRHEYGAGYRIPWLGLLWAILSGTVPKSVWVARMRICHKCPVFSGKERLACQSPINPEWGCHCFVPYAALTAEPYKGGCWGWAATNGELGWPAYRRLTGREDCSSSRAP